MSYFLRAGFIGESYQEIQNKLERILLEIDQQAIPIPDDAARQRLCTTLEEALNECVRAQNLLATAPSDPLVYTGRLALDVVLPFLEDVLAQAEESGYFGGRATRRGGVAEDAGA